MTFKKLTFLIVLLAVAFVVAKTTNVTYRLVRPGIGGSSSSNDAGKIQSQIDDLTNKINSLHSQEKTLQNEIDSLDSQTALLQLKIQQTQDNIAEKEKELEGLTNDITVTSGKIQDLAGKVTYQTALFNQRMRIRYEGGQLTPFDFIFNDNFNSLIDKVKYINEIEDQDNQLIAQLKETKQNYEWQKNTLETQKQQVEAVKAQIEQDKANLVSDQDALTEQRTEKAGLLRDTQGNEAVFQQKLNQARAELLAIQGAIASANFANGSKVNKGDVIAVVGNSGYPNCSTGAHLHFEVHKNGGLVNSETYLKPMSLYVDDYVSGIKTIGTGSWPWPLKNPQVTQRFGKTPYSQRYLNGLHTGVDMVSPNSLIYAPAGGKMIRGIAPCYNTPMNYVAIDHGNGVISFYFHVR